MRHLGFTPQETMTATDAITPAVNGAIQAANQRIQGIMPSIGANPIQRLTDMVNDPKFLEIIQIANSMSGKTTRTVGNAVIDMNPLSSSAIAADARLATAQLRMLALKLRVLASWLTLSRYAPKTLAVATVHWLMRKGLWDQIRGAAALARIAGAVAAGAGAATREAAQRAYAELIRLWHLAPPGTPKPPTPPGLTPLAGGIFGGEYGLAGLSGSRLKQAYRALHGLGGDTPEAPSATDDGAGNQSGTGQPGADTSGAGGSDIPPQVWALLNTLLTLGLPIAAGAATQVLTTVVTGTQQGRRTYHYNPDGTSPDGGQPLQSPPVGQEYDENGNLRAKMNIDGGGIPGWLMLAGALGIGWAVTRKS